MNAKLEMLNTIQAVNMALDYAMGNDPNVIVLGEDVADREEGGVMGVTKGLSTKYGVSRVRSTPISEQAIIGAAIGAAIVGMRPVAEIMLMNFTTVAMDMIVNHAAKLRFMSGGQTHVPMVIRTMTGAGFSAGGQHSDFLEAWFAHTAGLKVVVPSSPAEAYGLMLSCIEDDDPCIFIENIASYWIPGPMPEKGVRIPLGKANVVRKGADVTVIGYSRQVHDIAAVAEKLAAENIAVEVIDLRTISPLDTETILNSVAKTRRAVIVHEAVKNFGVGAEISARINEGLFGQLLAPVGRVGSAFCPVPFSKPLETAFMPSQSDIEAAIRATLK
ncbi:alpha-ketoacid dehydrogenase subunit beta [Noviherbaspirillum sedimenti]|uniref:Alpha-ketoacid dehydrogenase subunit beta n=1 Tax=Noviherbaspirillum sedimenti TaxID=2320865 RepID=A0A3A3G8U9_9BURK|nr:alpha-ketoacid dehydrogenase subunit beta [Noviherbaspirillum sedimenti]RJG03179.1 alpha-ketoacid dehydrogenase subunit beta [Noviherbaspirillum sedimenti]